MIQVAVMIGKFPGPDNGPLEIKYVTPWENTVDQNKNLLGRARIFSVSYPFGSGNKKMLLNVADGDYYNPKSIQELPSCSGTTGERSSVRCVMSVIEAIRV